MDTIEKKMYMVVGYMPNFDIPTRANVVIYGLYETMDDAQQRQKIIGKDDVIQTIYEKAPYVIGKNGMISWIKILIMGDLSGIDIKTTST